MFVQVEQSLMLPHQDGKAEVRVPNRRLMGGDEEGGDE